MVFVLLPDEVIPEVFERDVAPALRAGAAVAFGSGYCLAFDLIRPPDHVGVLLLAPRIAGGQARTRYEAGEGFWAFVGVEADRSGQAQRRLLGLAEGLGVLRAGAVEMTAAGEARLDLFVEQTSFRETGFLRASEEHGPTALFGGITRTLEIDREAIATSFRAILKDITTGGFARRFQDEARNGYPMLMAAREMTRGSSPIIDAEDRLRRLMRR